MSNINKWANFLKNEKLDPEVLSEKDTLKLMTLAAKLAEGGPPKIGSHADKIASRRKVCIAAFDLEIDLMGMKKRKYHGGSKPAIGRGLLDVWNEEYGKRFGGTIGTLGASEVTRRTVVTKMSHDMAAEKRVALKAAIDEAKSNAVQLADRFKLPLAFVQNQMAHLCGCQNGMVGTYHCLVHGEENKLIEASIIASTLHVPTPPDMYAKAIRALVGNGTTLEYIAERTGRSVEWLKKILEENPCSKPSTATSPLGQSEQTS